MTSPSKLYDVDDRKEVERMVRNATFLTAAGPHLAYPTTEVKTVSEALRGGIRPNIAILFKTGETAFLGEFNTYERSTVPQSRLAQHVHARARNAARKLIEARRET